ncbi:hypothetical protein G7Y89_g5264 [Cudoniella acicularis]|uniref:Uncharacterized protein n=1 Tax=Cudoniella acicularis TaxID=354080 RepID=A0A8H4RMT6_9HELO|nr:hypothetical protein G7Y89_g5264 [Cudoniella acicularis]
MKIPYLPRQRPSSAGTGGPTLEGLPVWRLRQDSGGTEAAEAGQSPRALDDPGGLQAQRTGPVNNTVEPVSHGRFTGWSDAGVGLQLQACGTSVWSQGWFQGRPAGLSTWTLEGAIENNTAFEVRTFCCSEMQRIRPQAAYRTPSRSPTFTHSFMRCVSRLRTYAAACGESIAVAVAAHGARPNHPTLTPVMNSETFPAARL